MSFLKHPIFTISVTLDTDTLQFSIVRLMPQRTNSQDPSGSKRQLLIPKRQRRRTIIGNTGIRRRRTVLGVDADVTLTLLMLRANRVVVWLSGLMLLVDGLNDGETMRWPKPHLTTRCMWGAKIGITTASGVCVLSFFFFLVLSSVVYDDFLCFFLFGIFLYFFPLFTHAHFLNNFRSIVVPVVVRIAARILFSLICIVVEVLILLCFLPRRWCQIPFCGSWRGC